MDKSSLTVVDRMLSKMVIESVHTTTLSGLISSTHCNPIMAATVSAVDRYYSLRDTHTNSYTLFVLKTIRVDFEIAAISIL